MTFSPEGAFLFFAAVVVAIITSLLGNWWISAYYHNLSQNNGTSASTSNLFSGENYRTPQKITLFILAIYIIFMSIAFIYVQDSKENSQDPSNITVVSNYNTYNVNNSYCTVQRSTTGCDRCDCLSINALKEFLKGKQIVHVIP
ncbi:hypothetical protein DSECCO2_166550 [anaerobic digester metagenome]